MDKMDNDDNIISRNANQIDNSNPCTSKKNKTQGSNNKNTENQKNNLCNGNLNNNNSNINNKLNLELYKFSYADFVLLSSTLAYAIGEDLNDADLDILIAFFGMLTADLAILRTRRGIINGLAKAAQVNNGGEEGIIGATEASQSSESLASLLSNRSDNNRKVKEVKRKRVKMKKVKRNNKNNHKKLKHTK